MRVLQANLHHAKGASAVLCRTFASQRMHIALIQEPWVIGANIHGLSIKSCKLVYSKGELAPRAAMLVDNSINFLLITEFTHRDLVSALLTVPTENGSRELVLASAYFPGDIDDAPSDLVNKLVSFCKQQNYQFIIGSDANAHHTVWGSTNINDRGERLLKFLCSNIIEILRRF